MADSLKFQHFEILTRPDGSPHVLGQGAMGTTYKAVDTNLNSIVVIKVINPQFVTDPVVKKRFFQEARVMAKVRHPNVASVFHLSECPNGVFFAMEFCDGPNLQEYVEANGALPVGDSFRLCQQVSSALHAAAERQLVHRDVKPSNLILVRDNQKRVSVKVIDFGLARAFGEDVTHLDLTGGGFVGTPNYASPEQLQGGGDLDIRSDIYSLGITLWYMLCGSPTFNGSHFEVMAKHVNDEPPWETLPPLPDFALTILHRMLKKTPEERYQTSLELWEDMETFLNEDGLTKAAGLSQRSILDDDKFEAIEEVGQGLAGKVFAGKDSVAGGRIAIKFVNKELLHEPDAIREIRRQLRLLNSIRLHPNILKIIAFDDSDAELEPRLIMEWVPGTNFEQIIRNRQPLSLGEGLPIISQLAQGIDFALESKLPYLELAPHQILVQTSSESQGRGDESKILQQPLDQWPKCIVKINPLRVASAPDVPSSSFSGSNLDPFEAETIVSQPNRALDETVPSIYNFCSIVYRLLGGKVPDNERLTHYVALDALSKSANEVIEAGLLASDTRPDGKRCADLVASLCQCEGIPVPGAISGSEPPGSPHRPQTGSSFGSSAGVGSSFEQQRNEIELKLRRLDLERFAAEQEGKLLGREEEVEQQRRLVEEERQHLLRQKANVELKLEEQRRAVEEGEQLLREERKEFDRKSSKLREEIEAQEAALKRERQQQSAELQQFLEERENWEREKRAIHEDHLREQREARERLKLEEGKITREVEERRQSLEKATEELEERRQRLEEELRRKAKVQTADIEAGRKRIEEAQKNLEERLSRQTLDLDEAQRQVETAREELRLRSVALERESAERVASMEAAMARQKEDLDKARNELNAERRALQEIRESQEEEFQQRLQLERKRLDDVASEIEARQLSLKQSEAREAAAEDERSLEKQQALRKEQLLLLEEDRKALAAERLQLQEQQRLEGERRSARENEDRERIAAREQELQELKVRLEQEADERQKVHQNAKVEFEALLRQEKESLAQERERIEKARKEGGDQALALEQERAELEKLRAELAEHRSRLDERATEERNRLEAEKLREFEQIGKHEADLTNRQADLKREQNEIQGRIAAEKRRLEEIEESRATEERRFREEEEEYAQRAARFAVVESNAERKLVDLRSKIAGLEKDEAKSKQRHKVRLRIIAAAVVVLIGVGVLAWNEIQVFFKDREVPGTKEWIAHTVRATELSESESWAPLLEQVVTTDQLLNSDTFKNKHTEILPDLMIDADNAVNGLLNYLDEGQSLPVDEALKLSSSLDHVIEWESASSKKLLLAKLHLHVAVDNQGTTAVQALQRYRAAYTENPGNLSSLKPDLDKLIEGLLNVYDATGAVSQSSEIIHALELLPEDPKSECPLVFLLLGRMKADEARKAGDLAAALQEIIDAARNKDFKEDWKSALRIDLDAILKDISEATGINELESQLSNVGNLLETPKPFMTLAKHSRFTDQLNYYRAAEKLGDQEAKAHVGMFLINSSEFTVQEKREAAKKILESAEAKNPVGLYLMAVLHLDFREDLEWEEDYEKAIHWAGLAKEKRHPDAEFIEGKAMLMQAQSNNSDSGVAEARKVLQLAAVNNSEAYWVLFLSYDLNKSVDAEEAFNALEFGTNAGNPNCMFQFANWHATGRPPLRAVNLTKARDLHLELVIKHDVGRSKKFLQDYARIALQAKNLSSREKNEIERWIEDNRHHWE